jgi:quercetin dioxygenase-like cupin family protein
MKRPIELQSIRQTKTDRQNPVWETIHLLPGAVEGVETNYYRLEKSARVLPARHPHRGHVLLFIRGAGEVETEGDIFSFGEIAALIAPRPEPITVQVTTGPVECLEILIALQEQEAAAHQAKAPRFVRYSHCDSYTEAIKSPKTISRTIVPTHTIPRFCMGSVETVGPDTVGAHSHPMLEQLLFGLPANACLVTADGTDAEFREGMLLHIPRGSWHGVRVEAGRRLHYVWMDFFKNEADLTYIQDQHKPFTGSPSTDS